MTTPFPTVGDSLLSMAPGLAVSLLAFVVWYFICRLFMASQDAQWDAALPPVPQAEQGGSYDVQIKAAQLRLSSLQLRAYAVGRGRPSDRLFASGLFVAGVIAMSGVVFLLAIA